MRLLHKYHPRKLTALYGQYLAQKIIRGILQHPEDSPRVLLFHGDYGTGKTTATQIFAQSLNCKHPKGIGIPCGKCDNCVPVQRAPYYRELDCGVVGNVDTIRNINEDLLYGVAIAEWQIVVFDEFHLASKTSQKSLVKALDSLDNRTFVVFVTTDLSQLEDTIKSRAVPIPFNIVNDDKAFEYISQMAKREKLRVEKQVLEIAVLRSAGHIRDLVKELEIIKLTDGDIYKNHIDYEKLFIQLLIFMRKGKVEEFEIVLSQLQTQPLAYLKHYFYQTLDRSMQHYYIGKSKFIHTEGYEMIKKAWRNDLIHLFQFTVSEWGSQVFENEHLFNCFLHATALKFGKGTSKKV